jgi:phosphate transport system permease protein
MKRRKREETFFKGLMMASLALIVGILGLILSAILIQGAPFLNLPMLVQIPSGGYYLGKGGGIANAIVGSLYLSFGATLLSFLLGAPIAFALQKEFIGRRLARLTRLSLDILWGTPSIVYGAFGFMIMVYLGFSASLLGGIIALSLLMLPIMTRSVEEVIRMISPELKEVSYALGTTRIETTLAVVLRQALPGMVTGVLLAFGRGIGDTASILFTAGYTDHIPRSLFEPVASLPLAIFFQVATPIPEVRGRAYASALVLLMIVLAVSLASRLLARRFSRHVLK